MTGADETAPPLRPALRIVSGSPSPEELAALAAVVASAGGADEAPQRSARGGWSDSAARRRATLIPGPNAWRSSAW